jgi:hypothetical protein
MIQIKTFEGDTLAALEAAVNTFLATEDPKDVLDTIFHAFSSAKYGERKTYVVTIVYRTV